YGDQLARLARALPRRADVQVFAALAPRCRAEAATGEYGTALSLASALGAARRVRLPELEELVAAATRATDDQVVRRAIRLWLEPSATRDDRVARVVAADRSTITIDEVATAVAARRTDLLDDVLRRPSEGRFLPRKLRLLPGVGQWSARWNATQVAAFRTAATALATDPGQTAANRLAGLRQLRLVPGSDPVLLGLAGDADVVIAEAALSALGESEEPRAVLRELVAAATTDRSRVAVPALRRCLERLAPDELAAPVRDLLVAPKVTVRKDAVRLVVDLETPDAVGLLERVWRTPGEHRDVRRAVAPSLRSRLDDARAWTVLAEAAADPRTASAVLDLSPVGVAPRHRARWTRLLIDVLTPTVDDVVARSTLAALARWLRFAPAEVAAAMVPVVTDLGPTGRWRAAVTTLVHGATVLADLSPVLGAAQELLRNSGSVADVDAGADRDRPVRQRLTVLAGVVADRSAHDPVLRSQLAPLVDLLAGTPATRDLAVDLAAAAVVWDGDPVRGLERLVAVAEGPVLAGRAGSAVGARLRSVIGVVGHRAVRGALAAAPSGSTSAAALVRLGVVRVVGEDAGWPSWCRDALRDLRAHDDPDVVRAAVQVVTASE
ncbi:hypothetical protein ACXR2U_09355, partial [Jatrophihabitans sp. YIM 134969]